MVLVLKNKPDDFVGTDRLLYASDHPWVDPKLIAANVARLNCPPARYLVAQADSLIIEIREE